MPALEEESKAAHALLQQWKTQLGSTLGEDSVIGAHLLKALRDAEDGVKKVDQAIALRMQIDSLEDSSLKQHMSAALRQMEAELGFEVPKAAPEVAEAKASGEGLWEVKVIVQGGPGTQTIILQGLHHDTTVGVVKALVEERSGVPSENQELRLHATKQSIGDNDAIELAAVGVRNRDTLLVIVKGGSGPAPAQAPTQGAAAEIVSRRVRRASVAVKGPRDALVLAVHSFLVEHGFTPVAAEPDPNGPKGFAPPVRPVPDTRLVPQGWNADVTAISFTYRHDKLRGRDIRLKALWLDDSLVLELFDPNRSSTSQSGGTLTIVGGQHVDMGASGTDPLPMYRDLEALYSSVVSGLLVLLLPQPAATHPAACGPRPDQPGPPGQPVFPPESGGPPFGIPVPNPLGPIPVGPMGGYGGRIGGIVPDFGGDLEPGGGGYFGPGSGNLMGPGHPLFTGEGGRGGFGGGGLGIPQPRFDPYGPVIGPRHGGPLPGATDPNRNPRGPGRAFKDPDPDHLPPPGPGNLYF